LSTEYRPQTAAVPDFRPDLPMRPFRRAKKKPAPNELSSLPVKRPRPRPRASRPPSGSLAVIPPPPLPPSPARAPFSFFSFFFRGTEKPPVPRGGLPGPLVPNTLPTNVADAPPSGARTGENFFRPPRRRRSSKSLENWAPHKRFLGSMPHATSRNFFLVCWPAGIPPSKTQIFGRLEWAPVRAPPPPPPPTLIRQGTPPVFPSEKKTCTQSFSPPHLSPPLISPWPSPPSTPARAFFPPPLTFFLAPTG